jgi:hypothetical protein
MNAMPQTTVPPEWVKEHKASFELASFQEYVKGQGLRPTGQLLSLFGRFDPSAVGDPVGVARSIHERLYALALDALRDLPVTAVMQVEPFGRGVVPLDEPLLIDVPLTLVASPDGKERLPPSELRRVIQLVDDRLRALGLKKR